ncbi:MAG TPA: AAA family ATPase, partial [Chthoniobacterales bacterium]
GSLNTADDLAERYLIGVVLANGFARVSGLGVRPQEFSDGDRAAIWHVAQTLHAQGQTSTVFSIAARMGRTPHDLLPQAAQDSSKATDEILRDCAARLKECFAVRQTAEVGRRLGSGEVLPAQALEMVERLLTSTDRKPHPRVEIEEAFAASTRPCTGLAELPIPPREKVLGDWFMEGDLGFIHAPRGLGKTWLSLAMASSIACGRACGPWHAQAPRKVLYVDGEMPCESLDSRIAGLGRSENLHVLNHEVLFHLAEKVLNLADAAVQEALTARMLADGISVLFLDNLSCLFSGIAENDADAWESVLRWLLILRRHRIAVVVVHHSGRNPQSMRGTSRREDAAFWVIRMDPAQSESGKGAHFISRFTKDRNSLVEQPAVEWDFSTGQNGVLHIDTREASSADIFREWIEVGLTGAEDIAREMGVTKGTVSKLARKGMKAGWLVKKGREYALADAEE